MDGLSADAEMFGDEAPAGAVVAEGHDVVVFGLFEEFASYGFTGAAFEEDVVGNNDSGAAVLL